MVFVSIELGEHEWGYWFDDGAVPLVGDTIELWHSLPDDENAEIDYIEATVIRRLWRLNPGCQNNSEDSDISHLRLRASSDKQMPPGHVSDSQEWPAIEHGKRAKEHEKQRAAIESLRYAQ
jgi:hypothetical protein